MVGELMAIFAAYGMGMGLVHMLRRRCHWGSREASHAVIVTRNVGLTIEWHLWSFAAMQWLKARHTKVTILDEGSTDDTVRIAERMAKLLHADWELVTAGSSVEAQTWLEQAGVDAVVVLRAPGDSLEAAVRV